MIVAIYRGVRGTDLALMPADGKGEPRYLTDSPAAEVGARISPDGRWLAFLSNESGRHELYLMPFEVPGPRWPITTTGVIGFDWVSEREIASLGVDGRATYAPR